VQSDHTWRRTVETKYLETALAVAEARSFTRVAREQNAAQSTISRQIAVLEAEVRSQLFTRPPGPVDPTAAGLEFLPRAAEIVKAVREAVVETRTAGRAKGRAAS
jgi:DNA-binding transcriptional LysR family regulator